MNDRAKTDFAAAYDDHVWDVYGFLGYRLRTREEAEDLTQTTFERALKAWSRFDSGKASEKTWLLAIARNVLIDHYRKNPASRETALDIDGSIEVYGRDHLSEHVLGPSIEIAAALEKLSERERELIALRFGGDMTGAQIAELTGLTLANVQQILSRSLRRLKDLLAPVDDSPQVPASTRRTDRSP